MRTNAQIAAAYRKRIRKSTIPTEHAEQVSLTKWAARHPDKRLRLLMAIPNGGKRHIVTARKMVAEGARRGVPDMFLPVAVAGCHGLWIELKRTIGGSVSKEQKQWHTDLRKQGYAVAVCKGWIAAKQEIEAYLAVGRAYLIDPGEPGAAQMKALFEAIGARVIDCEQPK